QPRQVLLALVETFGPAFGEAGGGDPPVQVLFTLPRVRDAEAIFFQHFLGATVHQRKRGAGKDGRHRASELRVDGVRLAEVGEFGSARHVGHGGQQRVLYDGTQQGNGGAVDRPALDTPPPVR